MLSIGIIPTPASVAPFVNDAPFLSGQLTTKPSFSQLYGYFEMRAQLPAAPGLNSAFWLLPVSGAWPPELDIEEVLGNDTTMLVMTSHTSVNAADSANAQWTTIPDASQGFHTYAVDWQADQITWFFDGKQVAQQATPADMHEPMYILIDTLSGSPGSWAGGPVAGETAQMKIDYIRAYTSRPATDTACLPQSGPTSPTRTTMDTPALSTSADTLAGQPTSIDANGTLASPQNDVSVVRATTPAQQTLQQQVQSVQAEIAALERQVGAKENPDSTDNGQLAPEVSTIAGPSPPILAGSLNDGAARQAIAPDQQALEQQLLSAQAGAAALQAGAGEELDPSNTGQSGPALEAVSTGHKPGRVRHPEHMWHRYPGSDDGINGGQ
jgi:beta-glucanase (GH16 family)